MKIIILILSFLFLFSSEGFSFNSAMQAVVSTGGVASCSTEADSNKGATASTINPIGSASYNDYAAQMFTAGATATICKATLQLSRAQADSSPAFTGKVCLYDATGYVNNTAWATNTSYSNGTFRRPTTPNTYVYKITSAGTCTSHATTEPTWNTTPGGTNTDNDCTWTNQGLNIAPGNVVGTCSDEINLITYSTTAESPVAFLNLSANVTSGTNYFLVFYTPTLGDAGDYAKWAYSTVASPSNVLTGGTPSSMIPGTDTRQAKFILYK